MTATYDGACTLMFGPDCSRPYENIGRTRKGLRVHIWRFCVSPHCRDLFLIALLAGIAGLFGARLAQYALKVSATVLAGLLGPTQDATPDSLVALQAGLLTVAGGIISWAYQSANVRFGVADVFAAEIATLCRVAAIDDFMTNFVDLFGTQEKFPNVDASRDYLAMYNSSAKDLEALDGDAGRYVTQFYVHTKALMDLLRHGANPRENPRAALNVIYAAFLAFESARQALSVLTDNAEERREYVLTAMLSEIPAYLLLLERARKLGDDEMGQTQKKRIESRLHRYKKLMRQIPEMALEEPSTEFSSQILRMWNARRDLVEVPQSKPHQGH